MMKAISLWNPWALGMALGIKRNETRSWPTMAAIKALADERFAQRHYDYQDDWNDHDS